jgi:hypothetical protein
MGVRVYNPASGVFATPDPILGGGANRYSYPTDPVGMTDLTGAVWGIDHYVKKTWYGSLVNPWNAPAKWYNYRGTKYIFHLTNKARNKLARDAHGGMAILVGTIGAMGLAIFSGPGAIALTGLVAYQAWAIGQVARSAKAKKRRMRITFYVLDGAAGAGWVKAWIN